MFLHYVYTILFFLFCGLLIKQNKIASGLILGVLLAFILPPLHKFFATVGADSLMELQKFELEEALFYLSTVYQTFNFYFRFERFAYYLITFFIIILVLKRNHPWIAKIASYRLFVLLLAVILFLINELSHFRINSLVFYNVDKNFDLPESINIESAENELQTIVYIGESSSAYNFSLYGYPQANTPFLNELFKNNKLLKFDSIANHTHTTQSLLSALSLARGDEKKDITQQSRVPITDILSASGIKLSLFSNQGKGGAINLVTPIIFDKVDKIFSDDALSGVKDSKIKKIFDHDFLLKNLEVEMNKNFNGNQIIFLHSYAGHGPYHKFIPETFLAEKHYFDEFSTKMIFKDTENKSQVLSDLLIYDQTIAYIDRNIKSAIELIDQQKSPMVFIYFSDHGDNAFDGTGHDSRLMDITMLNVPFVVYFNNAARVQYSDKWDYLKNISSTKHLITNDWVSRLLLYLHGVNIVSTDSDQPNWNVDNLVSPFVAFRETNSGTTFVPTDINKYSKEMKIDAQTAAFIHNRTDASNSVFCLHQSNDIISVIKGIRQTGCVESDIVFEDDEMFIYHPPMPNTNLTLDALFNLIPSGGRTQLWLDGKNINDFAACQFLEKKIASQSKINPHQILVEFPSHTNFSNDLNNKCINPLKRMGVNISYYVDAHEAKSCKDKKSLECSQFINKLNNLISKQLVTDLSYDKSVIDIIQQLNFSRVNHNSWSLKSHEFEIYKKYNLKRYIYQNNYL